MIFGYASIKEIGEMAGWSHHKTKDETYDILDLFIKEDKTFVIRKIIKLLVQLELKNIT